MTTSRRVTFSLYSTYLACVIALAGCHARKAPHAEPVPIASNVAAYVTNNGSDTVSVIDRNGDAVVARSMDVDPSAHEAPHHLAIDASGNLFVALAFPPEEAGEGKHAGHGGSDSVGALVRLDPKTLAVSASRDVDQNPGDVALTHDGRRVLVSHFDMRRAMQKAKAGGSAASMYARLAIFDATTLAPLAGRAVCVAPHGIAISADDKTALVACYGSDEIAVVDLASEGMPTEHVPIAAAGGALGAPRYGPYSVTLAPDGKVAVVADMESADVRVFDVTARRFTDVVITVGARAMMPDYAGAHTVLVPLQSPDGLARIDLEAGKIEQRASFGPECIRPHVVRVARDGRAYVVCEGDHKAPGSVLEFDPITLATRRRWVVGVYPDGIAFGG